MVEKIVHNILAPRHFWRDVGFDELSELYVSVMMRALAIGVAGIFIPIYMLRLGYSLQQICIMFGFFFSMRIITDIVAGFTVARIGPKHSMIIGCFLQICSMALFVLTKHMPVPLWVLGGMWGAASSYYFVPFNVGFSKVKHKVHGGKELSYANIMERIGATLGPVVGGVIATVFGAQYTFYTAIIILILSLFPLFRTAEPVRTKQKLDFKGFKLHGHAREYFSYAFLGVENQLSVIWWPLYIGSFVLLSRTVYAKMGLLISASVFIGIIAARIIGRKIDRRQGRKLLRVNATINALLHLVRPLIKTYPGAVLVNMTNEVVTVGYRLPFIKGLFDASDDVPGYRIVYLSSLDSFGSIVKASVWWFLAILTTVLTTYSVFVVGFCIAALASLLIMTERFKALDPKGYTTNHG